MLSVPTGHETLTRMQHPSDPPTSTKVLTSHADQAFTACVPWCGLSRFRCREEKAAHYGPTVLSAAARDGLAPLRRLAILLARERDLLLTPSITLFIREIQERLIVNTDNNSLYQGELREIYRYTDRL